MDMDVVALKITSEVDKSLNGIAKATNTLNSLSNTSLKVAKSFDNIGKNLQPTINKINDLTKTATDAGKKMENSLNVSPKMNAMDYLNQIRSIEKEYNELNRVVRNLKELQKSGASPGTGISNALSAKTKGESFSYKIKDIPKLEKDLETIQNKLNSSKKSFEEFKKHSEKINTKPIEDSANKLSKLDKILKRIKNSVGSLNLAKLGKNFQKEETKMKAALSGISKSFSTLFSKSEKGISNFGQKLKKLGLGLLSIRTTMALLTNAVSSYLAFDGELQDSITNSWNILGSLLAPAIELVARWFYLATDYVYNFIKALTGVDLVARANAKALDTQAKATKAVGQAQRSLTAMDEITNLQTPSAGGGGSDLKLIEADDIDADSIFSRIIEAIKNGRWYEAGQIIAEGINTALSSINWSSIQATAMKAGINFASLLNGAFENLDWTLLGTTIGNGIQTAISFAYGFVTTFNFKAFATGLASMINGAVSSIDWTMLGKTINQGIQGVLDGIVAFFKELDGKQIGENIKKVLSEIDWGEIASKVFEAMNEAFKDIDEILSSIFGDDVATLIEGFAIALGIATVAWTLYTIAQTSALAPILGIALAVGLVIAGIINFIKHIDDIKKAIKEFIDGFVVGFNFAKDVFFGFVSGFVEGFKSGFDKVSNFINDLADYFLGSVDDIFAYTKDFINGVKDLFGRVVDWVLNPFRTMVKAIKQLLKGDLLGAVITVGKGIANAFITPINVFISGLNLLLIPLRKVIQLLAKAGGKSLSMDVVRIPTIPKLATGTNEIESEGLYHLHEGEAVVPKKYNPATGGYDDGGDNKQIIDLLVSLNSAMLDYAERPMNIYMDTKKVAEATYDDLQQVGKNKNVSSVMTRS